MTDETPRSPEAKSPAEAVKVSSYRESHGLSRMLQANVLKPDGKFPDRSTIPDDAVDSVHPEVMGAVARGSVKDRTAYWEAKNGSGLPQKEGEKKEEQAGKWGKDMATWIAPDGSTIQWLHGVRDAANHTDGEGPALHAMLAKVGLRATDEEFQSPDFPAKKILERINADLHQAREQIERSNRSPEEKQAELAKLQAMDAEKLSPDQWQALNFYAKYLDGDPADHDKQIELTENLIEDLIAGAAYGFPDKLAEGEDKKPYEDQMYQRLDMVAPLLRTRGDEAQYALAAMINAYVHDTFEEDKVATATPNQIPKDHERRVLTFIAKHQGGADTGTSNADVLPASSGDEREGEKGSQTQEKVQPLEPGGKFSLEEVMDRVTNPEATDQDNPYWVGGKVPTAEEARAALAAKGGMQNFEKVKPFWTPPAMQTNFEPAHVFSPHAKPINPSAERFFYLESLTDEDSGLLALAGVAAKTPAEQARLYRTLSQVVLEIHQADDTLLGRWIKAQSEGGDGVTTIRAVDGFYQNERSANVEEQLRDYIGEKLKEKAGSIDSNFEAVVREVLPEASHSLLYQLLQDSRLFTEEDADHFAETRRDWLLKNQNADDRLLQFSWVTDRVNGTQRMDIEERDTSGMWQIRIPELIAALQAEPPILTVNQLRQIEFLSHSIDIEKVMEVLQEMTRVQESDPTVPSQPGDPTDPANPVPSAQSTPATPLAASSTAQGQPGQSETATPQPTPGVQSAAGEDGSQSTPSVTPLSAASPSAPTPSDSFSTGEQPSPASPVPSGTQASSFPPAVPQVVQTPVVQSGQGPTAPAPEATTSVNSDSTQAS